MMEQGYERSVPRRGARYLAGLRTLKERHACVHSVDGLGLFLNLVLADADGNPLEGAARTAAEIAQHGDFPWQGEDWRMLLSLGGPANNVIKLAPCLDITDTEIDRSLGVLDQVLAQLQRRLGG
jgi:4-aminobutyrate aminotransferase/(S)-3-amino-2-methylpropionate transaminase